MSPQRPFRRAENGAAILFERLADTIHKSLIMNMFLFELKTSE
jgi:hypothetical protein